MRSGDAKCEYKHLRILICVFAQNNPIFLQKYYKNHGLFWIFWIGFGFGPGVLKIFDWFGFEYLSYMNHRACPGQPYCPTSYEHFANVTTHGIAIIPAYFGLKLLLQSANDNIQFKSAFVFGAAVLSLFTMSTVYHSVSYIGKWKTLTFYLHVIDRATIYVFIASSYSPWLIMKESGFFGTHMRWLVWMLAFIGILYQYTYHEQYKLVEIVLYIFIGTFPALSVFSMEEWSGIPVMAAGGMVYIVGVIFFKCDGLIPYAHAIWHLHVVIGASFHYYAVHAYLLQSSKLQA